MERREFLRGPVLAGTVLLLGLEASEPEEALAAGPGKFYSGTLSGEGFAGWQIGFGIAYARVQGSAQNPDDPTSSLFMTGTILKNKLNLTLYAREDVDQTQPVGSATGSLHGTKIAGLLMLNSGGHATISCTQVKTDPRAGKVLAGVYDGHIAQGAPAFTSVTTLRSNGTFQVTDVKKPDGTATTARYAGVWAMTLDVGPNASRGILMMFLPAASPGRSNGILDSPCCDTPEFDAKKAREAKELADGIAMTGAQAHYTEPYVSLMTGEFSLSAQKRK